MRIMLVTRYLCDGGAERVTSLLANGFADLGHKVMLVTFKRTDAEYSTSSKVNKYYIRNASLFSGSFELRSVADEFSPDFIVSLGSKYHYLFMSGLLGRYKTILSERNDPARQQSWIKRVFVDACYKMAWGVVFQTDYARQFYSNKLSNCCIIPNPAPSGLPKWKNAEHRNVVISFCRLTEQKNIPLLLDSFRLFHDDHSDYILEQYGDGPLRQELISRVEELGLSDCVRFIRNMPDVHQRAASSRLFVSSSDYEGISNSVLEAISMGLPVVATDSRGGGSKFLLDSGSCGCLVPVRDAESMAAAMTKIADSDSYSAELSDRAVRYSQGLSLRAICDQWINFMNGANNERPSEVK